MTATITRQETRDGVLCEVTYTETSVVELTEDNLVKNILIDSGLDEVAAEDAVSEMKMQNLL
jgi:hypothetical protein